MNIAKLAVVSGFAAIAAGTPVARSHRVTPTDYSFVPIPNAPRPCRCIRVLPPFTGKIELRPLQRSAVA